MRRLSRRRSAGPEGTEPPAAAAPGPGDAPAQNPAEAEGRTSLLADPAAPTQVLPGEAAAAGPDPAAGPSPAGVASPAPAAPGAEGVEPALPVGDLPAGLDPDELAAVPTTSARRSRLRRRVAFLRAARELLLRDLGGFVYELHRTAGDVEHEAHRRLRATKLARLTAVDTELHELELRLDDVRRHVVVREPGVGGECPQCGALFGSDAHYCSHCGLALTESARKAIADAPEPAPPTTTDQATQELAPLDAGAGTEFRWPRRGAETTQTAADAGEAAAGETAADAAETATDAGEAASGGGDATAGGGDPAARDDATTAGGGDPATRDDATGDEPARGGGATSGGPVDGEPGGDEPADRRDRAPGESGDGPNGRAPDVLSRAERGT